MNTHSGVYVNLLISTLTLYYFIYILNIYTFTFNQKESKTLIQPQTRIFIHVEANFVRNYYIPQVLLTPHELNYRYYQRVIIVCNKSIHDKPLFNLIINTINLKMRDEN